MKIKNYGYIADLPDFRDYQFQGVNNALPQLVDLRPQMPPVYDQGQLGSCTANAIAGAFQFELMKQALPSFTPSRLLIYYDERVIEGTVKSDSGAQLRDGIKVVATSGVLDEKLWPYVISKFKAKPSAKLIKKAKSVTALQYTRLDNSNTTQLKVCLANGSPFVFGFTVYESFESESVAKTGIVPMPQKTEKVLGGHAVCCVGYDESKSAFIVRNSWGNGWALDGYCYMPYAYLTNTNLSDDFWHITNVS